MPNSAHAFDTTAVMGHAFIVVDAQKRREKITPSDAGHNGSNVTCEAGRKASKFTIDAIPPSA